MGTGRGSVTQDGGTSGTVQCSLWRRQGNVVMTQRSAFHRQHSQCFASRHFVCSIICCISGEVARVINASA
eukprot:12211611-Ditylum_brightwellii.AAC.2